MIDRRRLIGIARLEAARLVRLPMTFTLLLLVPALQMILFGYAIRPETTEIRIAVAAEDAGHGQIWHDRLARQPGWTLVGAVQRPGGAARSVADRHALIGLELDSTGTRAAGRDASIRIIVDATNPSLTNAAAARLESLYWQSRVAPARPTSRVASIDIDRLHNPLARADWTFLPALVGVIVMIAMIMLGSISVARERESGMWETLRSLPIHPVEALIGKAVPYTVIGTAQGALVLAGGCWLFDLPVTAGAVGVLMLLPVFAAAHFILGYLISTRAATQLAALQGAIGFYLPAMLLSGFLYPFETLPRWAQRLGELFPLTHFIRAAHAGILQDRPVAAVLAAGAPIVGVLGLALLAALAVSRRSALVSR